MIRTLAIISAAGFLLAAACLSVAVALVGPDAIASGAWNLTGHGWDYEWRAGHGVSWSSHGAADDDGQATRSLPWVGETLEVDVPADVRVTQSDGAATVVVRGPKESLSHLVVNNGRLAWDQPGYAADDVSIEITAPKISRFTVNGGGRLDIEGYRQDGLALRLNGAGDVSVHGRATAVDAAISGSGDADLSGLSVDRADVRVSGSGDTRIGPRRFARIDISGSGVVTLTARPDRQETHVSGSGHIEEDGAAAAPAGDRV